MKLLNKIMENIKIKIYVPPLGPDLPNNVFNSLSNVDKMFHHITCYQEGIIPY